MGFWFAELLVDEGERRLLGEREFAMLKSAAYFVNTGRLWTTDEEAPA